jgi:hypothetical protein
MQTSQNVDTDLFHHHSYVSYHAYEKLKGRIIATIMSKTLKYNILRQLSANFNFYLQ